MACRCVPCTPLAAIVAGAWLAAGRAAGQEGEAEAPNLLPDVVITAPLPGGGVALEAVPANVQRVTASDLDRGRARDPADALNQLVGSVSVNDTQGSPFQPNVSFRGFTGSPVLGTPQGVSVFVDGVRVNEAFGDAVNWDLIPQPAIAAIEVVPGSNPVFGLNTLGGAIAITTRRGLDSPSAAAEILAGSFGRRHVQADAGGYGEHVDYFVAGNAFDEDGWGEHNPSRVRQGFAKLGYRQGPHDLTLAISCARGELAGNQTLPRSFLGDRRQAYSWPDTQRDELAAVDLNVSHRLGLGWTLAEKLYYREVRTQVLNSNVNDGFDPLAPVGPGNEPTGNAIEQLGQYRPGVALQLVGRGSFGGHRNTLIAGASLERAASHFWQFNQEAGSSRDTTSSAPAVLGTSLAAHTRTTGVYLTDTLGLGDAFFLNLAARYNDAALTLEDGLGTALNGEHHYGRLNPAVGGTFRPSPELTFYARYEEGMRVPTPVELTCADPHAPCSLPNAFAADPPLAAVIAKTVELGARGALGARASFTAAAFRTQLDNDLQFVSSGGGSVSAGYFRNVGETRRQGLELGLEGRAGRLTIAAHYTWLDATFRSPLVLNSRDNSTARGLSCAACREIEVVPGDRLASIPRQIAKLRAEFAGARYALGATLVGQSGQYARGDENNRDVNGMLPGFVLVNLDGRLELGGGWSTFLRIDNLFDRAFYSFATLGENVFTAAGDRFDATGTTWRAEQFRTVGAPRGTWLGIAYRPATKDRPPPR